MKQAIILIFVLILNAVRCLAVPSNHTIKVVRQKDGSMLHIRQYGDESFHFYLTTDSIFVISDEEDAWYYAIYRDGEIYTTETEAHDWDNRSTAEQTFIKEHKKELLFVNNASDISSQCSKVKNIINDRRKTRLVQKSRQKTYFGEKKGLVILVNFENASFSSATAHEDYDRMFNEHGFSDNNHVGSVSDYFYDQSCGKFNLKFDVIGPLSLPHPYGYYGTNGLNPSSNIADKRAHEMIYDACQLADSIINFADYDWDEDGFVDQVFIIYAGYGEATGGPSNTVWPHESELRYFYKPEELTFDGVTLNTYACSNELYHLGFPMGIGTACHEFSHCLGFPDLYDTDYSGAYGMNHWSVMDAGSYNGPRGLGEVPSGFTSFERYYAGWLDFVDVESTTRVDSMVSLGFAPEAYRVKNRGNENEYYTIEYRNDDKWFGYIGTQPNPHGLLVTHVDYDSKAWENNLVNPSPTHPRLSVIPADNSFGDSFSDYLGDLFSGTSSVTCLGDDTHLNVGGKLFNKNTDGTYKMGITLNQITEEEDGTAGFSIINNKELYAPQGIEVKNLSSNSFSIVWEQVPLSDSYSLEITWVTSRKPFKMETLVMENITSLSYKFEEAANYTYKIRLRSCLNDIMTEWSDYVSYAHEVANEVERIADDSNETTPFDTYNVQGINVRNAQLHGIYIENRQGKPVKIIK